MSDQNQIDENTNRRLFVGNLPWGVRAHDLEDMFSEYGELIDTKVIIDKATGRSKGYGFVEFRNLQDAMKAKEELNGGEISGRVIKVQYSVPLPSESRKNETIIH